MTTDLPAISPLTFGSGGITDPANPEQQRVTRAAMEAGIWFHVANYGLGVYPQLKRAFGEAPGQRPHCIVKIDGQGPELLRNTVHEALRETGLERIAIGQVCGNPTDDSFDSTLAVMAELHDQGLVGAYIMDVIYGYGAKVAIALDRGIFAGYIFYLNVTERELPQPQYERMTAAGTPILAMRTFGGRCASNFMNGQADDPKCRALQSVFERADCTSRAEFCVRFPLSLPNVRTTIGSTGRLDHLHAFLGADRRPPAPAIVSEVEALHATWNANR